MAIIKTKYAGHTARYFSCDGCFNHLSFELYSHKTDRECVVMAIQCGWGWYATVSERYDTKEKFVLLEICYCPLCRSDDANDPYTVCSAKEIEDLLREAIAAEREKIRFPKVADIETGD